MTEPTENILCKTFTISFIKGVFEAESKFPELTTKDHLTGFGAYLMGAGVGIGVEAITLGTLKGKAAHKFGKGFKKTYDSVALERKKAKNEDIQIKIKGNIQMGDETGDTDFDDLFRSFYTKLAVDIFFHFKSLMDEFCSQQTIPDITLFEAFGEFAGKLCYKSCKDADNDDTQAIIKSFVDRGWFEKSEKKIKEILGLIGIYATAARDIFTVSVPAYWLDSMNPREEVIVKELTFEGIVFDDYNNLLLRPPFDFEQTMFLELLNSTTGKPGFSKILRHKDFKSFRNVDCTSKTEEILNIIKFNKDLDPLGNNKQHTTMVAEAATATICNAIADVGQHTDVIADALRSEFQHLRTAIETKNSPQVNSLTVQAKIPPVIKHCLHFTGRKKALQEIDNALQVELKPGDSRPLVIITGLGGIGKTQTARKYAHEQYTCVNTVVIFINAETLDSMRDSFVEATKDTFNPNLDSQKYTTEKELIELAKDLYRHLSNNYNQKKVLIIFDNAEQLNTTTKPSGFGIYKFLPNNTSIHVLVTSQNNNWNKPHTVIKLEKLDNASALALLEHIFRQNLTDDDEILKPELLTALMNLQKILDGFPLGISVAGADILDGLGQDKISQEELATKIQNYRLYFDESNKQLDYESESVESDYDKKMTNILNLAISRIKNKQAAEDIGEKAIQLLHIMSYLSPDGIDEANCFALFYAQESKLFGENDEKLKTIRNELKKCVQILKNMSLVTLEASTNRNSGRSIQLHRLVQKITRKIFKENVDALNSWFKPLYFVVNDPPTHASHVLQNICSTFQNNIPLVALASAHSVFPNYGYTNLPIELHERIKELLEAEQLDTLQQDLKKFVYHLVCLREKNVTYNVNDEYKGHVTKVVEIMKAHVGDLWVQYIGIHAFETFAYHKRLFTQGEENSFSDWMELFADTQYQPYTGYMEQMYNKALFLIFEVIESCYESEGKLSRAEAYIKFYKGKKHSVDTRWDCKRFFWDKMGELANDFKLLLYRGDDITRQGNVFRAAVDIFTKILKGVDTDCSFEWICSEVIKISHVAEIARMFRSSQPFMDAFLQGCISSLKTRDTDSFREDLLAAAATLMALFEEASDEDIDLYVSTHEQIKTVSLSILDTLQGKRDYRYKYEKGFTFVSCGRSVELPIYRVESFMSKHGKKDVWFVKVALAGLAPARFLLEHPAVPFSASDFLLRNQESQRRTQQLSFLRQFGKRTKL